MLSSALRKVCAPLTYATSYLAATGEFPATYSPIHNHHICAFFHSLDEEYKILLPFIQSGFEHGDKAYHIVDPKTRVEHLRRLQSASIDVAAAEARRQLEVRGWQETYLRTGHFDQSNMIVLVEEILRSARLQGFPATRWISHMEWILEDRPAIEDFLEYESRLNYVIPKYRSPVVCVYNSAKYDLEIVMDVLRTHPAIMVSGIMYPNPFFVSPDELLRELREHRESVHLVKENAAEEGRRLQRAIRDLVALAILPATWLGREPGQIGDEMLSILINGLQLDAAHICLRQGDGAVIERSHAEGWPQFRQWLKSLDASAPGSDPIPKQQTAKLSAGGQVLNALLLPIGMDMRAGFIAVGSSRADFPGERDMLVLTIAANQGLIAYQNARLIHERERAATELKLLKEEVDRAPGDLLGSSPVIRKVQSAIRKVAPTDSTVLITGETGTGKELAAKAIHQWSRRADQPFISINCAALPASLIGSEIFGHEKGAFTGAAQRRLGRFELADKGTLFLDEVGELPPETQVLLLRVLEEQAFERLGGTEQVHVDVRLIAATNRDLQQAVEAGSFRSDLYYRLNVVPIHMPPLRDRKEDIPILTQRFIDYYAANLGRKIVRIDPATMDLLQSYRWPGNVRELQNVIERSLTLREGDTFSINVAWLTTARRRDHKGSLLDSITAYERELIENALHETKGKVAGHGGAARRLGVPSTTLESRIKVLSIDKNRFRG